MSDQGPRCSKCRTSEARCAFAQGCCETCTHWLHFTAEGFELPIVAPGRKLLPVKRCGTEDGYWQHSVRHEPPCPSCRMAHLRYKGLVA